MSYAIAGTHPAAGSIACWETDAKQPTALQEPIMNIPANTLIVTLIVLFALIAVVAWALIQHQRTVRLKRRFGPEYAVAVAQLGSRSKAEAELSKREARVSQLKLVPLSTADAARFAQSWKTIQGRFVDNPKGAVAEADQLVRELMFKRGYPMGDFDRLAADISVDHPSVVSNYRDARAIAVLDQRGQADTEQLRRAVVHYRTLFDELLTERAVPVSSIGNSDLAVHS
jgi:hypothetical protein